MVSCVERVPKEFKEEVENMIKKIQTSFGVKISRTKASKIILLKSKSTNYLLTEKELLKIIGG